MSTTRTAAWVRRAGLAAGLAVALAGLLAWQMPNSHGQLGLDLQVTASPTGELGITPLAPFVSASAMRRGDSRTGRFTVRNETHGPVEVRIHASAQRRDADSALHVRLTSGGAELFDGALGALRRPTARTLRIPRRGASTIAATLYIPRSAAGGFEGRIVDLQLDPVTSR